MTETEWQFCQDPEQMVKALPHSRCQRELRLFSIACVRRTLPLLPPQCLAAILAAEGFVNGNIDEDELNRACSTAAVTAAEIWPASRAPDARAYATSAAVDASSIWPRTAALVLSVSSCAASAMACAAAERDEDNFDHVYNLTLANELVGQANLLRDIIAFPVP